MNGKILRWPANLLCFVFVMFFLSSLRQLLDYDVWFQLLAGQETVRTVAVPKAEFYIYPVLGEPSVFVGWLWGLLLYLAWLAGGYVSVSLFNALIWGAIFVTATAAILARGTHEATADTRYSRKALVLAALIATSVAYQYLVERAALRAEVTLYLAWAAAIYLSVDIASDVRRQRRFLIAVPLLSWALGWLHTSSIFMVLLLSGYLAQAAFNALCNAGSEGLLGFLRMRSWPWLISILAAVVLPWLNPNGVDQAMPLLAGLRDVLRGIFLGEWGAGSVHGILEYQRLVEVRGAWPAAALFLACSIVIIGRDRSHRIANALFLTIGILLSLLHVRAMALWAVFLMIPLGAVIIPMLQKAVSTLEAKGRGALINGFVAMCCFWVGGVVYNKEGGRWGVGYWPTAADEQVLQALRENMPDGGRIFNWHPTGAYLRWHLGPKYFVAIDGHLVDANSGAWKAYYEIQDFPDKGLTLIDKWNIQAVYQPVLTVPRGHIRWLPYELANRDDWRLVAGDPNGLVFVRAKIGEVDERTRNLLKISYWRKVLVDAINVAMGSTAGGDIEQARKVVEYADRKATEIQALLK
ncbi:MAG: hypothetical protein ACT4P8_05220 [Betaproteobacteria bacterium]